jgi:hypothetical protein
MPLTGKPLSSHYKTSCKMAAADWSGTQDTAKPVVPKTENCLKIAS